MKFISFPRSRLRRLFCDVSSRYKLRRPGASGMTLVEILITITILAALFALLTPAIRNGINRSRAAKCVANLRNIGIAHSVFLAENDHILPYKYWYPSEEPGQPNIGGAVWYGIIADRGVGDSKKAHTCLSASRRYETTASGKLYGWANYGWNAGIPYNDKELIYTTNVAYASRFFLAADSTVESKDGSSWLIQHHTNITEVRDHTRKNNFDFRHDGKANILFLDTHIEARTPEEIPLRTPMTNAYREFWKGTTQ